jgi:hypothetical protein
MPSPTVFAVLGLMRERGILDFPLSVWPWRKTLKETGILGSNWLPFYESVRRGWTNDKALVSEVKTQKTLASMLAESVTFLDIDIISASHIDLKKQVYVPKTKDSVGVDAIELSAQELIFVDDYD